MVPTTYVFQKNALMALAFGTAEIETTPNRDIRANDGT